MNGEGLYATVLQLFCQRGDDEVVGAPAQSGFHRYGGVNGLYYLFCNFEHEGYVLQHTSARPFACHLLYRAAKVDVDDVGVCLLHNLCSLYHGVDVAAVYLYAYGTLFVADGKLIDGRLDRAYEGFGAHKLGVNH